MPDMQLKDAGFLARGTPRSAQGRIVRQLREGTWRGSRERAAAAGAEMPDHGSNPDPGNCLCFAAACGWIQVVLQHAFQQCPAECQRNAAEPRRAPQQRPGMVHLGTSVVVMSTAGRPANGRPGHVYLRHGAAPSASRPAEHIGGGRGRQEREGRGLTNHRPGLLEPHHRRRYDEGPYTISNLTNGSQRPSVSNSPMIVACLTGPVVCQPHLVRLLLARPHCRRSSQRQLPSPLCPSRSEQQTTSRIGNSTSISTSTNAHPAAAYIPSG